MGRTGDASRYDRPHSEAPIWSLGSTDTDVNGNPYGIDLPGSASSFRLSRSLAELGGGRGLGVGYRAPYLEIRRRFAGAHARIRRSPRNAMVSTNSTRWILSRPGSPAFLYAAYDRAGMGIQPVPYNRTYRAWQFDAFAQDAFRATPRFTSELRHSIRPLRRSGECWSGQGLTCSRWGRVRASSSGSQGLHFQPIAAAISLYSIPRNGNWRPRFGFSYDLSAELGKPSCAASTAFSTTGHSTTLWQIVSINPQIAGVWSFIGPVSFASPRRSRKAKANVVIVFSQYHNCSSFNRTSAIR